MYPAFIAVVGHDNKTEAELWNNKGRWHVTDSYCLVPRGEILVDDMPAHWIEQLRRYVLLGREIERRKAAGAPVNDGFFSIPDEGEGM